MEQSFWACYAHHIKWFFQSFQNVSIQNGLVSKKYIVRSMHWLKRGKKTSKFFSASSVIFVCVSEKPLTPLIFRFFWTDSVATVFGVFGMIGWKTAYQTALSLALNFEKTVRVNPINPILLICEIHRTQIETTPVCKNLSVCLDFTLCFNTHINVVLEKRGKQKGFAFKLRHCLPRHHSILFYKTSI